jgi:two-component system cell cycle response regulator
MALAPTHTMSRQPPRESGPSRAPPADESFDGYRSEAPTSPVIVIDSSMRDRGVLIETSGVFAGRPHTLGTRVSVGRSHDCVLRIEDEALSRTHAHIDLVDGHYVLEDAGSLNGCFVGDRRVKRQMLMDGDRVRFGPTVEMRFQVVTDDEQRSLVRIYEAGLRDALTGLANRNQLEEHLRAELSFARRHRTELAVAIADVDRFKAVNDTHGHLVGDAVLKHVANVLSTTVRVEDLVARFGGEEFVVVARATSLAGGAQLAERLRAALERQPFSSGEVTLRVTASFGVASATVESQPTVKSLLGLADERLYAAKAQGRNRVVAE